MFRLLPFSLTVCTSSPWLLTRFLSISMSPAVHSMLPSRQQFVYGTLFAKLIFPRFMWEPTSREEREGDTGKEGERERGRGERARVWKWGRQLQSLAGREKHGQGSVCAECRRLFLLLFWKEIYVFGRQNCQKTFSLVHPARLSWSWRLLDWPYDYTRCYSWSGNCSPSASEVELSKEEQRQGSVREERALRVGASPPPTLLHHQLDGGPGVLRLLLL